MRFVTLVTWVAEVDEFELMYKCRLQMVINSGLAIHKTYIKMHTVQNYKLSNTKQISNCGKQDHTAMSLMILKWKIGLKICTEFTKMLHRICKLCAQNFQFFFDTEL